MKKEMLSLKDVYNNVQRFCHIAVLINLKEIIESKDVEIGNCKSTICKRNLIIKQLREKIKFKHSVICTNEDCKNREIIYA